MTIKADHYAELLENARCEGKWDLVPELVRKVRKHASSRSCLAFSAETECAISNVTTTGNRPSATDTARDLDVSNRMPKLERAIEEEDTNADDKFQARVCVGWLHWVVGNYDAALEQLPNLRTDDPKLDLANFSSEWTHVCALKAAYLRANCLMRDGKHMEALAALESAAPVIKRVESGQGIRKQLRYWTELFLTEYCVRVAEAIDKGDISRQDASTLAPFRSWANFWDVMQAPVTGGLGFKGSVPRRQIWKDYYLALSYVLQNDLPYEPGLVAKIPGDMSARAQLRCEVKYVEAVYRSLLLAETTFPRADEERSEVEAFVGDVMKNWSVLCGRGWREADLGPGGRGAISLGVLELLFGAATKTYHSTTILRSLFLVHLSLAEFDLAFKAFDSYLEIIKKGKARERKTGECEPSLDSDDTVLETMAQGVMALCRYGHRDAGEKARRVGADLEDWLSRLPQTKNPDTGPPVIAEDVTKGGETHPTVSPHIVALAWQAIGLSHAHWSRLTSEAGSRLEIQTKAIRCLRKSLSSEFGRSKDLRSFFGLALLLAERRELTAAIELTRSALMSKKGQEHGNSLLYGPYWQERSLVPLWHLLALLLSAKQDFGMAFRACEGALEELKDPTILFGRPASDVGNEHVNGGGASAANETYRGLVDDMDDSEKEGILEIKMTQLALIELTEGPEMAVNASHELLTMFSRLFNNDASQGSGSRSPPPLPPRTAGTFRTIRGSLFGSHKAERSVPSTRQPSASIFSDKSAAAAAAAASRPSTSNSGATNRRPAIQVTSEGGDGQTEGSRSRRASSSHGQRSESKRRGSLKKRNRSSSRQGRAESEVLHQATLVDGDVFFTPGQEMDQVGAAFPGLSNKSGGVAPSSRGKGVSSSSHFSSASRWGEYGELSTEVTHATPHLLPLIRFPKEKEKRQRTAILMRIWLTVAGFYRRAKMLEDCKAAILEAQKLVEGMETESHQNEFDTGGCCKNSGWAERRRVEDFWGDVWAELGLLALSQGEPYVARSDFEQALTYCPDHTRATVGLCNLLLDMYSEKLLKHEAREEVLMGRPKEGFADGDVGNDSFTWQPLGLRTGGKGSETEEAVGGDGDQLPAPYKARRLPLVDRLAARDRAFTLLTGLTRLGSGWDDSDAWFALARAYEESGQLDKAKEVLWWCVELEEGMGVREWRCVGGGGYVI